MIIHFDPSNVSCEHVQRFLYEYVERDLDARLLMAMDNHVLSCQACGELVDSYEQSVETTRRLMQRSALLPDEVRARLIEALTHKHP